MHCLRISTQGASGSTRKERKKERQRKKKERKKSCSFFLCPDFQFGWPLRPFEIGDYRLCCVFVCVCGPSSSQGLIDLRKSNPRIDVNWADNLPFTLRPSMAILKLSRHWHVHSPTLIWRTFIRLLGWLCVSCKGAAEGFSSQCHTWW